MSEELSEEKRFEKKTWLGALSIFSVFLVLFIFIGYASGYGRVVNNEVVFIRATLSKIMVADFARDGGEWSFGYVVPVAVAVLFWFKRKTLTKLEIIPAYKVGGIILCFGFLLYWAGYRGEQKYFGYAAGQVLALGCIFWFLGWAWFRNIFWLWVLFGMMWPWRFLIERVSAPLQLIMVKTTTAFLDFFGVGAVASGSGILTDTKDPISGRFINMDVDVACSGMRSLFAMVMIGIIVAFVALKIEWKRWVLMAFVPIVAVFANFVRMLLLYFGSRFWGTEFAIGPENEMSTYHLFAGLVVFVVALILLLLLVAALEGSTNLFRRKKVVSRKVK